MVLIILTHGGVVHILFCIKLSMMSPSVSRKCSDKDDNLYCLCHVQARLRSCLLCVRAFVHVRMRVHEPCKQTVKVTAFFLCTINLLGEDELSRSASCGNVVPHYDEGTPVHTLLRWTSISHCHARTFAFEVFARNQKTLAN